MFRRDQRNAVSGISNPHPFRSSEAKDSRINFRFWIEDLISKNKVICFYPRVGRGSVVVFNASSNDELHGFMTQWLEIVSANFEIYPLATPAEAEETFKGS